MEKLTLEQMENMTEEEIGEYYYEVDRERAQKSYKENNLDYVYCSLCGELLVAGSISYYEGYHIDGC